MRYDMKRWYEGFDARRAGMTWNENPYPRGSWECINWKFGYLSAK